MEIHRIAEHLSRGLGRSVIIVDPGDTIAGAHYRAEGRMAPPRDTIDGPAAVVHEWLRSPHARRRSGTVLTSGAGPTWVTYPLLDAGDLVGWALVRWEPEALSPTQLALVDIAAGLAAADRDAATGGRSRRVGMRRLLDTDPAVRREGLRHASTQRWVARAERPEVRALIFDGGAGLLMRLHWAQELCRALPVAAEVLRERDDAVFILTHRGEDGVDLDQVVRAMAARVRMGLRAVGSASLRADDEDLARAAHAAETAAALSSSVPELTDVTNGDGLGGWALLSAVPGRRDLLAMASPAAETLCALGDTPRETVEVYLDEAGHVRAACERLHVHRTTLYYRLDNLPDVVKAALADGMQRSTLHLALKLDRLWSAVGV